MRILFVARHFAALRNFESVVRGLAARGHQLELAALQEDILGGDAMVRRWASELPGTTVTWAPGRPAGEHDAVAQKVRFALDWVRYLSPVYRDAPRLVERARERTPRAMLWLTSLPGAKSGPARQWLGAGLRALERALPRVAEVESFLGERRPDVVVLTPLIGLGSPELDYLRSAKALGLPTLFGVWSWDNLSSKALIRWVPDRITVWNDTQRREAVSLHNVPADRVVVTGAQCFDQWFERAPSQPRGAFCARIGLPPDPPFVLYVCSALFRGSRSEAEFVRRWLEALRGSGDARLTSVPVLVRPHPSRLKEWDAVSLEGLGPAVLWGRNPVDPDAKAGYYDSLSYAAAVVGLNTSAFLEAAIVGKPVLTVLLDEFHENQGGTLHFPYLLEVGGGLLHSTRSLDAHVRQLADVLASPASYGERSTRFVETFLRPFGRGEAATPRVIAAVESLASGGQSPTPGEGSGPLAALALSAVAHAYRRPLTRPLFWDPIEAEEEQERARRLAASRAEKAQVQRERTARRRARKEDEQREKAAARAAKEEARSGRMREKRRRQARERRQNLAGAVTRRVRRLLGMGPVDTGPSS